MTVRLSPGLFERLPHLLEPALVRAAVDSAQPASGGWITVTIPLESVDYTAGVLLRLGDEAEVLAPARLRQRMAFVAGRLAKTYQES